MLWYPDVAFNCDAHAATKLTRQHMLIKHGGNIHSQRQRNDEVQQYDDSGGGGGGVVALTATLYIFIGMASTGDRLNV